MAIGELLLVAVSSLSGGPQLIAKDIVFDGLLSEKNNQNIANLVIEETREQSKGKIRKKKSSVIDDGALLRNILNFELDNNLLNGEDIEEIVSQEGVDLSKRDPVQDYLRDYYQVKDKEMNTDEWHYSSHDNYIENPPHYYDPTLHGGISIGDIPTTSEMGHFGGSYQGSISNHFDLNNEIAKTSMGSTITIPNINRSGFMPGNPNGPIVINDNGGGSGGDGSGHSSGETGSTGSDTSNNQGNTSTSQDSIVPTTGTNVFGYENQDYDPDKCKVSINGSYEGCAFIGFDLSADLCKFIYDFLGAIPSLFFYDEPAGENGFELVACSLGAIVAVGATCFLTPEMEVFIGLVLGKLVALLNMVLDWLWSLGPIGIIVATVLIIVGTLIGVALLMAFICGMFGVGLKFGYAFRLIPWKFKRVIELYN